MHPERLRRTAELRRLAAEGEWEQLYQRLMLSEFPYEARMGWQLAFLRPFAVPRMAEILTGAGHLIHNPRKRAYDTGLIIYEIVYGGFDSPRTRQMISLINRAHHGRGIDDEDMTYVLCAFIVTPIRYIGWVGWRRVTDDEKRSAVEFFGQLGRRMNIRTIPSTYAEAERFYDDFEERNVSPSAAGRQLGANLVRVLKDMQPKPARPLATPIFTILLNDRAVSRALGLRPLPRPLQRAAIAAMRLAAAFKSQRPPRAQPIFTPGKTVRGIYPHGYDLADLGPNQPSVAEPMQEPGPPSAAPIA